VNVGAICRRRIVAVDAESTLAQAATLMREHHVGALVVTTQTGEGTRVSGVVTDRDLVIDVLARGLDAGSVAIGELARQRIASVAQDDDLTDALGVMQDSGVRRLLVTDAQDHLVGIVSLDDVTQACALQMDLLGRVIRSGLEREVAENQPIQSEPLLLRIPAMGTAGWGQAIA
jgi:CBS domain-containing protein